MNPPLDPVVLTGTRIELQPLHKNHRADLCEAVAVDELWRITVTSVPSPATMGEYIDATLELQRQGLVLPFAILERSSGRAVGSSRYLTIRRADRGLEIGGTWLGVPWQRTAVNTEAKYLLLKYAFETLGCMRVELKTNVLNERSRRAIERLGAKQEGIFRKHVVMPDGRIRDSVYYSILDDEWPAIKTRLDAFLAV